MFTSFSTALSALNATATAVDVVGNNLANLNTPGFKTNVVYFRDLVTQSLGAAKQPLASTQFTLDFNLNAAAAPDATSRHSETIKVFDSLGGTHVLTVH